jgi:hypothetical protein
MGRKLDDETAEIIALVRTCQAMNVLPLAGGLFDQDSYFVYLLQQVISADTKKAERDRGS